MIECKSVDDKRRFSVTLTEPYMEALDRIVKDGLYIDHQAALRDSLRHLLMIHNVIG